MPITLVIPKEAKEGENRVAMVPSLVNRLIDWGINVKIQKGAGDGIFAADSKYLSHENASLAENSAELYGSGDIVIKVNPPTENEVSQMKDKAILISFLNPHTNPDVVKKLCSKNITSFAMEMVPRISRAQTMDVLSSQSTVSGYKAVIIAANVSKFFLPRLSTAAGSIRPAKVLVIGAGVAGLQAISTARRLGAIVEAYDVRPETKEQVESLGAKFVQTNVQAVGEGGYARELTAEEKKQQQDLLAKHIASNDIVITAAGVPGKPAPKIISQEMVESMKPGSVIVDIMADNGGNCILSKAGESVIHNNVRIEGPANIFSSLAVNASEMYAKNIMNFLELIIQDGNIHLDWNDEIIAGSAVTHEGKVVNEGVNKILEER
jgi:NAD(P) transhydrogenase subunit alpha